MLRIAITILSVLIIASSSKAHFSIPVPLQVSEMHEFWSGFLNGVGVRNDELRGGQISETCFGDNTSQHLIDFTTQYQLLSTESTILDLFDSFKHLEKALIEVSEECHLDELGFHMTFHSFKLSFEQGFTKLIQNALRIEEEWGKAMDAAVMREFESFGDQLGKIVAIVLQVASDATLDESLIEY